MQGRAGKLPRYCWRLGCILSKRASNIRCGQDGGFVEKPFQQALDETTAKRKFYSKSKIMEKKSADEEAFVRLRIRARRILDDLHQGFFGTEDDHPRPIPSALCAAAPPSHASWQRA